MLFYDSEWWKYQTHNKKIDNSIYLTTQTLFAYFYSPLQKMKGNSSIQLDAKLDK
jgi:hypothetical protein